MSSVCILCDGLLLVQTDGKISFGNIPYCEVILHRLGKSWSIKFLLTSSFGNLFLHKLWPL